MGRGERNALRRPIHVALITSGQVGIDAGGAYTADEALLRQITSALRPDDDLTVVRLLDSRKKLNSREPSEDALVFRRSAFDKARELIASHEFFWRLQSRGYKLPKSRLESYLVDLGVDLVIMCTPEMTNLDWQKLPYWVAFWDLGHRALSEFPELTQNRQFELRERMYKRGLPRASMILTESDDSIKNLAHSYGLIEERMLAVHLLPDLSPDTGTVQKERDPNLAIYPAQFWPHKNHVVLLQAISHLIRDGRSPKTLVLTGTDKGNESYVKQVCQELQVDDHVVFAGFVSTQALRDLYSTASITVMPSLLGPTNLPPIEALFYGCPVAASHARDAQVLSETGVTEISPFDVSRWADMLDRDVFLELPDKESVRKEIEARLTSNQSVLKGALDLFAQRRSLWA